MIKEFQIVYRFFQYSYRSDFCSYFSI